MVLSLDLQANGEGSDNIRSVELFVIARESYVPSAGNLMYGWGMLQGLGKAWSSYDMVDNEYSGVMGGISLDNANHMCFNAYQYQFATSWLTKTSVQEDQIYDLAFFGALEYNPLATVLLDYQLPLSYYISWCKSTIYVKWLVLISSLTILDPLLG